jgi:hypothetical protein
MKTVQHNTERLRSMGDWMAFIISLSVLLLVLATLGGVWYRFYWLGWVLKVC